MKYEHPFILTEMSFQTLAEMLKSISRRSRPWVHFS